MNKKERLDINVQRDSLSASVFFLRLAFQYRYFAKAIGDSECIEKRLLVKLINLHKEYNIEREENFKIHIQQSDTIFLQEKLKELKACGDDSKKFNLKKEIVINDICARFTKEGKRNELKKVYTDVNTAFWDEYYVLKTDVIRMISSFAMVSGSKINYSVKGYEGTAIKKQAQSLLNNVRPNWKLSPNSLKEKMKNAEYLKPKIPYFNFTNYKTILDFASSDEVLKMNKDLKEFVNKIVVRG